MLACDISDSKGPGGGSFRLKKCGRGVLQLSGKNTYSGQTVLEEGTLCVSSLNSVGTGSRPVSSLGAPKDVEMGELLLGTEGRDAECVLAYTGTGETTDRVLNLVGKKMTITLDHSGSGLLKFTSPLLISGYGASKTLVVKTDAKAAGECAGAIANPHDRAGKAMTGITKTGLGPWTLSGVNTYTGPTVVKQGSLIVTQPTAISAGSELSIAAGASVELKFKGQKTIRKLILDGQVQQPGLYDAARVVGMIKGPGALKVQP